jgi:hypothetical protein
MLEISDVCMLEGPFLSAASISATRGANSGAKSGFCGILYGFFIMLDLLHLGW